MSLYGKWDYKRFDIDAVKYFKNIVANGGTISATSKAYVNKFVIGMKAANVWNNMYEIYPLMGDNLAAAMVKLKYITTPFMTNHNFVSGDYVETGSGAGLTGDGSTKYIDTNQKILPNTSSNTSLGLYRNKIGTTSGGIDFGNYGTDGVHPATSLAFFIRSFNNGTNSSLEGPNYTSDSYVAVPGSYITERGSNGTAFTYIYSNGVYVTFVTQSNGSVPFANTYLMALDTYTTPPTTYTPTNFSNATLDFAFYGTALQATQITAINTLMTQLQTSLGRN